MDIEGMSVKDIEEHLRKKRGEEARSDLTKAFAEDRVIRVSKRASYDPKITEYSVMTRH